MSSFEVGAVDFFNVLYDKYGFDGVINEVKDRLVYGTVEETDSGLYCITTGGWSDDESLINDLLSPFCRFRYHYKGFLVGGSFYFTRDKKDTVGICLIIEKTEDW